MKRNLLASVVVLAYLVLFVFVNGACGALLPGGVDLPKCDEPAVGMSEEDVQDMWGTPNDIKFFFACKEIPNGRECIKVMAYIYDLPGGPKKNIFFFMEFEDAPIVWAMQWRLIQWAFDADLPEFEGD